jgi:hypothetical protein
LDDLPAGAFTAATQRELLRRCTHWPAASEAYAVVAPAAGCIWEDVAALQRVIAAPTKVEEGRARTTNPTSPAFLQIPQWRNRQRMNC